MRHGLVLLILVPIAVASGSWALVVKAVAFIVLTVTFTLLALGAIAYFALKHSDPAHNARTKRPRPTAPS